MRYRFSATFVGRVLARHVGLKADLQYTEISLIPYPTKFYSSGQSSHFLLILPMVPPISLPSLISREGKKRHPGESTMQPQEHSQLSESSLSDAIATRKLRIIDEAVSDITIGKLHDRVSELEREVERLRQELEKEQRRSLIDPLTGIVNRLAYMERAEQEYTRWLRHGKSLSLIIWDIDHFKSINDDYGHQFGDKVLKCVASRLSRRMRKSDLTARYGGEEFVTLLPECNKASARDLAESLRREIEDYCIARKGGSVQVTISCGIAEIADCADMEALFQNADAALYEAKAGGRNRVCVA